MNTEGDSNWDSPHILSVLFHPQQEHGSGVCPGVFDAVAIPVDGGATVGARFYPTGTDTAKRDNPTILFFHGNGEIVADHHDAAFVYTGLGVNFMPVDYRGYGRSTGTPTVSAMLSDASAVLHFAQNWLGKRGHKGRLIAMGRSLGAAAALELAARHPDAVSGLIIESGFVDPLALLKRLGWHPSSGHEMHDTVFRHIEKIRRFSGPTLIIHGTEDRIIPVSAAETLHLASMSQQKRLVQIQGADHNSLLATGFEEYFGAISEFLFPGTQDGPGILLEASP